MARSPTKESEAESLATLARAAELGVTFLDTAWVYQHPSGAANEELARARACNATALMTQRAV